MKIYRQGDLIIKQVESVPESATRVRTARTKTPYVLAIGEATGHAHRLSGVGEVFVGENKRFFKVADQAVLEHEEHGATTLPAGTYEVDREQEHSYLSNRTYDVVD